jgi:isoleucyl-tRNA synthetase
VPGWDCHGLPIEGKAMNEMKVCILFSKKIFSLFLNVIIQLSPHDTPVVVIRKSAEATALREIDSQKEQFRSLAIMADWDSKEHTYRTLGAYTVSLYIYLSD